MSKYTDSYEKTRRALPMGVPAELLWRQLPPTAFATPRFVISAQLEPWHEVGGDAFDYSLDGDTLHVAVFARQHAALRQQQRLCARITCVIRLALARGIQPAGKQGNIQVNSHA